MKKLVNASEEVQAFVKNATEFGQSAEAISEALKSDFDFKVSAGTVRSYQNYLAENDLEVRDGESVAVDLSECSDSAKDIVSRLIWKYAYMLEKRSEAFAKGTGAYPKHELNALKTLAELGHRCGTSYIMKAEPAHENDTGTANDSEN